MDTCPTQHSTISRTRLRIQCPFLCASYDDFSHTPSMDNTPIQMCNKLNPLKTLHYSIPCKRQHLRNGTNRHRRLRGAGRNQVMCFSVSRHNSLDSCVPQVVWSNRTATNRETTNTHCRKLLSSCSDANHGEAACCENDRG